jgi:hypothetical protein
MLDKSSERSIILLFSPLLFLLSFYLPWPLCAVVPDASVFLLYTPVAACRPPYRHWPHSSTAARPGHPAPSATSCPTVSTPWPPCVPVALRLDHLDDSAPPRTNGSVPAPRPQGGASWGHVCKPRVSSESRKHGWSRAKRPSAVLFDWQRDEAVSRVV